ncbi:MAG: PEP-CTERM sorting domain-containing protein, partial [candidate division NC10 bacterium]
PTSGFFQAMNNGTVIGTVSFEDFITAGSFFDSSVMFGNNSVNRIDPILASDFGAAAFNKVVFNFGGSGGLDEVVFAPVPEPGTLLLIGSGLVGLGVGARRRNRRK